MIKEKFGDVAVALAGHVAQLEIRRPPHNFFDVQLIRDLADAFNALDADSDCRALVLSSEGEVVLRRREFHGNRPASAALSPRRAAAIRCTRREYGCFHAKNRSWQRSRERRLAVAWDSH